MEKTSTDTKTKKTEMLELSDDYYSCDGNASTISSMPEAK